MYTLGAIWHSKFHLFVGFSVHPLEVAYWPWEAVEQVLSLTELLAVDSLSKSAPVVYVGNNDCLSCISFLYLIYL